MPPECKKTKPCAMRTKNKKCTALDSVPLGECSFAKPDINSPTYTARIRERKQKGELPWFMKWPYRGEEESEDDV